MSVPRLPSQIPRPLLVVVYYLLAVGAALATACVLLKIMEGA